MKTRLLTAILAGTMIANPLAVLAADDAQPAKQMIDLSVLTPEQQAKITPAMREMLDAAMARTNAKQLIAAKANLELMMGQLESIRDITDSSTFLRWAKRVQAGIVLFNTRVAQLDLQNKTMSNAQAYGSFAASVLNMLIRHWNPTTNRLELFDANKGRPTIAGIAEAIDGAITEVNKLKGTSSEMDAALAEIAGVKQQILKKQSEVAEKAEQYGGSQDIVVIVSGVSAVLHWVSPKLGNYMDKFKEEAGAIKQGLAKGTKPVLNNARKGTSTTSLVSGLPDFAAWSLGMSSDEIQAMVSTALLNLKDTQFNLERAISKRNAGN